LALARVADHERGDAEREQAGGQPEHRQVERQAEHAEGGRDRTDPEREERACVIHRFSIGALVSQMKGRSARWNARSDERWNGATSRALTAS
jgi:hypothetical protein